VDGAVFYDLLLPFFLKKTLRRQTHFLIPSHSIVEIAFLAGTPQEDMLQDDSIHYRKKRRLHSRPTNQVQFREESQEQEKSLANLLLPLVQLPQPPGLFSLVACVMQCLTRNGKLKTLFSTGF
jgi:hypothetical protein